MISFMSFVDDPADSRIPPPPRPSIGGRLDKITPGCASVPRFFRTLPRLRPYRRTAHTPQAEPTAQCGGRDTICQLS